ncbi:hypothetical protein V1478_006987 [Vespula squamosa]|uniref:Uncharacterized protein n=1 Tax=Vespula squamosa TaxID=30214 RepID=A0ABD2B1X4_VESSQ
MYIYGKRLNYPSKVRIDLFYDLNIKYNVVHLPLKCHFHGSILYFYIKWNASKSCVLTFTKDYGFHVSFIFSSS